MTGGARILVIDDDPSLREALGDLLSHQGYEVGLAGDGLFPDCALDRVEGVSHPTPCRHSILEVGGRLYRRVAHGYDDEN